MGLENPGGGGPRVLIRKYRHGDEKQIVRLVNKRTMVTVNPFFFKAARREMIVSTSNWHMVIASHLFIAGTYIALTIV